MKTNSLMETNPYLKDPVTRERLVRRSVVTSCGVEGVKIDLSNTIEIKPLKQPVHKPQAAAGSK